MQVRAGLTPKFKDVEHLCEMLTYKMASAQAQVFQGQPKTKQISMFDPPIEDFTVASVKVNLVEAMLTHWLSDYFWNRLHARVRGGPKHIALH